MGGRVWGVEEVRGELYNIADRSSRAVRHIMDDFADLIAETAQMNAPHRRGALEDAIKVDRSVDESGRALKVVYVDENVVAYTTLKGRQVLVGDYAVIMHEWDKGWGEGSKRKWAMLGRPMTGADYLTRAFEEYEDEIVRKIEDAIARQLR